MVSLDIITLWVAYIIPSTAFNQCRATRRILITFSTFYGRWYWMQVRWAEYWYWQGRSQRGMGGRGGGCTFWKSATKTRRIMKNWEENEKLALRIGRAGLRPWILVMNSHSMGANTKVLVTLAISIRWYWNTVCWEPGTLLMDSHSMGTNTKVLVTLDTFPLGNTSKSTIY